MNPPGPNGRTGASGEGRVKPLIDPLRENEF